MTLVWIEKGFGLITALEEIGVSIRHEGGVTHCKPASKAVEAQALVDSYDPLPDYKELKVAELKVEALTRIEALFPALNSIDEVKLLAELWTSIVGAAKSPTGDFQQLIDTYVAAKSAIVAINALATTETVTAYDVATSPTWP